MSAVWIYAVPKVSFGPCLLSAALTVSGFLAAFLLQKVSGSGLVSPCGGSQSSSPLSEKFTAYLSVKFQLSLGGYLLGDRPSSLRQHKFQTSKAWQASELQEPLQLMVRDRKQEFLCSSASVITAREVWITQGKPVNLWVSPVTQGIQVPQVLQALEIPGLPELAGSFLSLRIPGHPGCGGTQQPCRASHLNYSPQPAVLCRKVHHKYHSTDGTDGTCFENVVFKDTLRSPCFESSLYFWKYLYLQCIYI